MQFPGANELPSVLNHILATLPPEAEQRKREKLDNLHKHLICHDYETIIKDKKLFWLTYCKALGLLAKNLRTDFRVQALGNFLIISGTTFAFEELQTCIEELRKLFLDGLKNRECKILVIPSGHIYYFRKESPLIDVSNTPIAEGYNEFYYRDYVHPALSKLVEYCGAFYAEDKKSQNINYFTNSTITTTTEVSVIRITWKEEFHLTYPILPKPPQEREKLHQALYTLYQEQKFFGDAFEISFKEGSINVHASLLYMYGGKFIQNIFDLSLNETIDKKITLTDFSKNIVLTWIDFIYFGEEKVLKEMIDSYKKNNTGLDDIYQIFEFANFLQNESFINCCTNLISLFATHDHIESIRNLNEPFHNEHLQQLIEYFSPQKKNLIKV